MYFLPSSEQTRSEPLEDAERKRRRLVNLVIGLSQDTSLYPTPYELQLLDYYVCGQLTIDQVLDYLNTPRFAVLNVSSPSSATFTG